MKAVITYRNGRVPSVTIGGLAVSRFARQIDGTYTAVLDDAFGGEIDLDQRLTLTQVLGLVQDAAQDAEEHGEPAEVVLA